MNPPEPTVVELPEVVVGTEIAEYRPIVAALHDLYVRHAGVIHDCTTTQGMQDCRAARAEIRTCRTSLEAKRREIKAPALERSRLIDADAKRITETLVAIEDPLDAQIKAEEEAAEARREAKRRAEMERQAELRRMVESINLWPVSWLGATAQQIREAIAGYETTDVPSGPEIPPHYQAEAAGAKGRALEKLRDMLRLREAREAEETRLAAEREAERQRQAAEDKRLREERQRLDAEQHRQQALRQQAIREAAEEQAELDRQRVEHARIERELAKKRALIDADRARAEASEAWEPAAPSIPPEPYEPFDPSERRAPQADVGPGTTVMRIRFEKRGGHYHCRVFTAPRPGSIYEKCGDLVFREAEWPDIPLLMRGTEFFEETSEWP